MNNINNCSNNYMQDMSPQASPPLSYNALSNMLCSVSPSIKKEEAIFTEKMGGIEAGGTNDTSNFNNDKLVTIAGVGTGNAKDITREIKDIIGIAKLIFASQRIKGNLVALTSAKWCNIINETLVINEIEAYYTKINTLPTIPPLLLYSGDAFLLSGASAICTKLRRLGYKCRVIYTAASTPSMLAAILQKDYCKWHIADAHSMYVFCPKLLTLYENVFVLCGVTKPYHILEDLMRVEAKNVYVTIATSLGTSCEQIVQFYIKDYIASSPVLNQSILLSSLCCVLLERNTEAQSEAICIAENKILLNRNNFDKYLITAKGDTRVPFTKSYIRSAIINMLNLNNDDLLWEIGAGTGAISIKACIEVGCRAVSFEMDASRVEIIRLNCMQFACYNIEVVYGEAPAAFIGCVSSPTVAFIGGSSGKVESIIEALVKMPTIRKICASCVLLTTLASLQKAAVKHGMEFAATQISINSTEGDIAKPSATGMLHASNPIFLCSLVKKEDHA